MTRQELDALRERATILVLDRQSLGLDPQPSARAVRRAEIVVELTALREQIEAGLRAQDAALRCPLCGDQLRDRPTARSWECIRCGALLLAGRATTIVHVEGRRP